jgi:hypothetical protein
VGRGRSKNTCNDAQREGGGSRVPIERRLNDVIVDDSVGFDVIERAYVRKNLVPDFEWVDFDRPSPRNRLGVALADAGIGLVSTAGAHLPEQRRMGAGGDVRMIPVEAGILLSHGGYQTDRASRDPEVVFPVRTLERLVRAGFIGSLAPSAISNMGYIPLGERVFERVVPPTIERLRSEEVDLALLVPA